MSVCSLFVSTLFLKVPPNGPEGFLNDYTLKTNERESKLNPSINTCEQCDEQYTAVSYCSVCSAFLCESCTAAHKTIKFLNSHEIESLQSGIAYLPAKKDKILPCSQHPDKSLELYCKTCQCLVCMLCIVTSHNGHKLGNINCETRKGVERQIKHLVAEAELKLAEYKMNLEYIGEVEKETVDEPVQIIAEINSLFDSLATILESRRAVLLETVETSFNKDLKELWAQKEHMETTIGVLRGTLTFAKQTLQCAHDLELLVLGSQVMARLKELNKLQWERESTEIIKKTARKFDHKTPVSLSTLGELKTTMMTAEPPLFWDGFGDIHKAKTPLFLGDSPTAKPPLFLDDDDDFGHIPIAKAPLFQDDFVDSPTSQPSLFQDDFGDSELSLFKDDFKDSSTPEPSLFQDDFNDSSTPEPNLFDDFGPPLFQYDFGDSPYI